MKRSYSAIPPAQMCPGRRSTRRTSVGHRFPYGAPNAAAHVERLIGTLRHECLGRILMNDIFDLYSRNPSAGATAAAFIED
jgi:hypothetical protein